MPLLIDVLAGLFLALLLYWLVRFRMVAAPAMRDRVGAWARWLTWVVVALLMILVANLALFGLRLTLKQRFGLDSLLAHEIIFALVALAAGYFLVARYATRGRRIGAKDNNSNCGF